MIKCEIKDSLISSLKKIFQTAASEQNQNSMYQTLCFFNYKHFLIYHISSKLLNLTNKNCISSYHPISRIRLTLFFCLTKKIYRNTFEIKWDELCSFGLFVDKVWFLLLWLSSNMATFT